MRDDKIAFPIVTSGVGDNSANLYLILLETVVNVVESAVPTAVTAVIMTTAINAAIKPYSIAVAPLSSAAKRAKTFIWGAP